MGYQSRQRRNQISMESHQPMTPSQIEHLKLIDAHLERLLDIASKRTPGEWEYSKGCTGLSGIFPDQSTSTHAVAMFQLSRFDEKVTLPNAANNAAFIAAAAGNAEAGWRATRAAIACLLVICDPASGADYTDYGGEVFLCEILAAFPLESLKP